MFSAPAAAQQTGGNGGSGNGGPGGTGGSTDALTGAGTNGAHAFPYTFVGGGGGGGGGAGTVGGSGGNGAANSDDGSQGGVGGVGGSMAVGGVGGAGGDGGSVLGGGATVGAGGGGGGAHGGVLADLPGSALAGGAGGAGGAGNAFDGGGGGGGGGYGAFITGTGGFNNATIRGGAGGAGGNVERAQAGGGGLGGVGVFFAGSGTLINSGTIAGGDGGRGGTRTFDNTRGPDGAGGVGVIGAGLTIENANTISGGLAGDGVTRANAITFTGGINSLTITSGSIINGNVVAFSTGDTFGLGGAVNASFDLSQLGAAAQYRGFGILEKSGSGTWTVTGTSGGPMAYRVNDGTLDLNAATQTATTFVLAGGTLSNGTLSSTAAFDLRAGTVSATLDGTGAVDKTTTGIVILTGANTYSGGTTISGGVIRASNDAALGTGVVTVASGAALELSNIFSVSNDVTINGMGVAGGGALRHVAGNGAFNGTITLGSASRINSDGGASLFAPRITGNNTDLFVGGDGDVIVFDGITTGTGSVTKDGHGTLLLAGTNTYTGVTTVNQGTLRLSNGSAIVDTGAIVVNSGAVLDIFTGEAIGSLAGAGLVIALADFSVGTANTSTTFSGEIRDSSIIQGRLDKTGTGTFTLAGVNTYTGRTIVNDGKLVVDGSIAASSLTTVNAGATLGGNGTVGNTTINGGTLAPGNSIGLLTVRGNLALTAASSYMVEVSPSNADRVNVTGTATLGGATVNANFAPGSYVNRQYTIVNAAGGVIGTFGAQVNTDLPSNFKSRLSYDANNAYLDLTLDFTPPTPPPDPAPGPKPPVYAPLNGNQAAVGNALVGFFDRTGGIPLVFGALNAPGLSQVSGELGTGSQQTSIDAMRMFMFTMTDPFGAGRGMSYREGPFGTAYAATRSPSDAFAAMTRKAPPIAATQPWNVWAAGFGGSQATDGNAVAGSTSSKSGIYGMAVGADYWFSPLTVAGFSLAGGGTTFSVNGGGSGRSDLFQAGAFVRHSVGSAYVTAAAAYGWQDITTDRTVTVAGFEQLRANFNANSYSGRVETGSRFVMPWIGGLGVTPYVAAQVTAFDLPSYAETGAAGATTFALAYAGKTITATRTELGFRSDKSFAMNDAILTLRGRAAWAHDFDTDRWVAATFQTLPGASFVVTGAALARNAALTTASAELNLMNGWSVAGSFEGEFSDVTESYGGKGVVRYAW